MTDANELYADLKWGFLLSFAAWFIAAWAFTNAFANSFIFVPLCSPSGCASETDIKLSK